MSKTVRYERTTLRGLLRTAFVTSEAGPAPGHLLKPTFLTLIEPIDVEPNKLEREQSFFGIGHSGLSELHIVPMDDDAGRYPDFDAFAGCVVEITGDLFPGFNRHHFRPVLLSCKPDDITLVSPFALTAVEGAKVLRRGSGIVINQDGHILTADHVTQGQAYSVRRGLERAEAQVVAIHPEFDLAILKTDLFKARDVLLRTFLGPLLGESVFVCGYPLRPFLEHSLTMTTGIVSGHKAGSAWVSAPIQKGNSGGPVFDAFGNVLALVNNRLSSLRLSEIIGPRAAGQNDQDGLQLMNFAMPLTHVSRFLTDHSVEHDQCFFMEDLPEDAVPLHGTHIAERAQRICVEVESWEVRS